MATSIEYDVILGLSKAAAYTGNVVSKSTIYGWIKSGKVDATQNEDATWDIHRASLDAYLIEKGYKVAESKKSNGNGNGHSTAAVTTKDNGYHYDEQTVLLTRDTPDFAPLGFTEYDPDQQPPTDSQNAMIIQAITEIDKQLATQQNIEDLAAMTISIMESAKQIQSAVTRVPAREYVPAYTIQEQLLKAVTAFRQAVTSAHMRYGDTYDEQDNTRHGVWLAGITNYSYDACDTLTRSIMGVNHA